MAEAQGRERLLREFRPGERGGLNTVAWLADGRWLASESLDATVRLWEPASGREVALVGRHANTVWTVAFSPDGACLSSASEDGAAALWDVADLVQPRTRLVESSPVRALPLQNAGGVGTQIDLAR